MGIFVWLALLILIPANFCVRHFIFGVAVPVSWINSEFCLFYFSSKAANVCC